MAALPSPTQVAGSHSDVYEALYSLVDPNGFGTVGGMEAARFLKHSGLSDVMLSRIWDLSDPGGRGCLDKAGVFVALKLVALVQNGRDLSIKNVGEDVAPPKMGDLKLPKIKPAFTASPVITSLPPSAVDWTIKPSEREKYDKLFDSLQPLNGLIPGNKVKSVLMESKLPFDTLGKIWDLADQDKDGMLNRHEFVVAMHLVYKALEKYAIPNTLPPELMPPLKERNGVAIGSAPLITRKMDGIKPELPPPPVIQMSTIKPVQSVAPTIPWVVTAEEKAKSDALFIKSDVDMDGFVSGGEIKDVFLRSGVPQPVLAHLWSLCDINQTGKLNNEQFALAMWLIARCLKGLNPPPALTPEMIPPSLRPSKPDGLLENNNARYSNPELDMITKDIEELQKEKFALETDIAQKEADIKIKTGEIKNLQSELDTLATTLKQLENQKGEAQKRLNDLKTQVDKLRTQAAEQAELVATQEAELKSKKEQLEGLKMEEQQLEQQKAESLKKLEEMTSTLQETQLSISQVKALITQLQEETRQIKDAMEVCDTALTNGDASQVPDVVLRIKPDSIREAEMEIHRKFGKEKQNGFADDPFHSQNGPFNSGFDKDAFTKDPFASSTNDPFTASFSKPTDDFGSSAFDTRFGSSQHDPFDNAFQSNKKSDADEGDKDAFGCDPFAVLHAPTRDSKPIQQFGGGAGAPPRPPSPSPALPPKKSKQPPPRPAPPRPSMPPSAKKVDMFGGDPFDGGLTNSSGGFEADFSDFDSKFSSNDTTTTTTKRTFNAREGKSRELDFVDDPFKNYRYEDPFNITFEDDDDDNQKNNNTPITNDTYNSSLDALNNPKNAPFGPADAFDPFGLEGRQSVPLPAFKNTFFSVAKSPQSGRASAPLAPSSFSEAEQIEWASKESVRLEEERRRRQAKEDADLELAINLSKISVRRK